MKSIRNSHRSSILILLIIFAAAYLSAVLTSDSGAETGLNADSIRHIEQMLSAEYLDREIIIKFKDSVTSTEALIGLASTRAHSKTGAVIKKRFRRWKGLEVVRLSGAKTMYQALKSYLENPDIEYAEPNYIVRITAVPDDPDFTSLWGLHNTGQTGGTDDADIDAREAWDIFAGSSAVVVAVIDSGVDYNHPDLAGNIWSNTGEVNCTDGIDNDNNGYIDDCRGWDFLSDDNDPDDDHGHGTHCSGTVGAVGDNGTGVTGINWGVQIMPLKFIDSSGYGTSVNAALAIRYAVDNGAKILNNSWGGYGLSNSLKNAIQYADDHNVLFVAAAGNGGSDLIGDDNDGESPFYPASYNMPNIISVAATNHSDSLAEFSNYGTVSVDLAAPGVNILSTKPGNIYMNESGTSMAAPHVSGVAALISGKSPGLSHLEIKDLILNNVDVKSSLSGKTLTGGRLNAYKALDAVFCSVYIADNIDAGTEFLILQDAYDTAFDGDFIKVRDSLLIEDLFFGQSKSITIDGGYDCSYTHNTDGKTTLNGTIIINEGVVTIGNIVLE